MLNQIILLSDKYIGDIRTEDNVNQLKKSITTIKTSDLKIGRVYNYYNSTDVNENIYDKIVYLGEMENAGYLHECAIFITTPRKFKYHVFLNLFKISDYYGCADRDKILGMYPSQIILMRHISKKIRSISNDQVIHTYDQNNKYSDPINLNELISACKSKIERYMGNVENKK